MQRADLLRRLTYGREGTPPPLDEVLARRGIDEEARVALRRLSAADWAEILMLDRVQWWQDAPKLGSE